MGREHCIYYRRKGLLTWWKPCESANMAFAAKNLVTKAFVMKFVELVFVFIVFLMFRIGDSGNMFHWGTGFLTITDSPPNNDSPPTTSTLTSPPMSNQPTATTTSNQPTNNPFVQH